MGLLANRWASALWRTAQLLLYHQGDGLAVVAGTTLRRHNLQGVCSCWREPGRVPRGKPRFPDVKLYPAERLEAHRS